MTIVEHLLLCSVVRRFVTWYNRNNVLEKLVFTALHKMQTRSSDENSVRLCVCQTRGL